MLMTKRRKEGADQGELESKNGYQTTQPSLCNDNERLYHNQLQTHHLWGTDDLSAWPSE